MEEYMTAPKYVAKTLRTLLENEMVLDALDRTKDIVPIAQAAEEFWSFDLLNRKPAPAYDEHGIFKGTDLDLACMLYAMSERGAVIKLPYYKSATRRATRKDQELISKGDRHGKMAGLVSNQNFFKFSVRIIDENVVGEDSVGDFRTFSLTDYDGEWYPGWQRIQFVPTRKENRFLTESKLWTGNVIYFKNFIHPNRWVSFFGQYYVISKIVVERLAEEIKFLNAEMKRIKAAGIEFPEGEGPVSYEHEYGDSKSVKFLSFEAKIFIPEMDLKGDFPAYETTQEGLVQAYRKRKLLARLKDSLSFMCRATEYSHYKNPDKMPQWIKNVQWEDDFVEPGKRTKWQRLKLFQPEVGKHAVSILKRTYEKSAQVAPDY
jgi:hypothetical protein